MSEEVSDIRQIQIVELEILKAFIDCCEKLGLKYFLLGGTMLGAVRHQGFIPWDDDIDVGLYRKDYERFINEAPNLLPNYYFVQSINSEPNILFNFAKLRDSRTTFIEKSYSHTSINHGIYIDLFPLDYYPDTIKGQKIIDRKKRRLDIRIRKELKISEEYRSSSLKECLLSCCGLAMSIKYPKVIQALRARERLFLSVPQSSLIANYCGAWGKKEIVPQEWYGEGRQAVFEGISVTIPTHYDKWLQQVYGDYMSLPPVEKRIAHHYTDVIDLDKPYTEYISSNKNLDGGCNR